MVKLDVLAEVLAALKPVRVRSAHCLAKLTPKAPCDACRRVCPEGAITLSPAPILSDCSACGLCAAACPTDAFALDDPSDQQLLQRVSAATGRFGAVTLACSRAKVTGPHVVGVTCLGRLTVEFLVAAVACGPRRIDLVRPAGACHLCAFAAGGAMAEAAVDRVMPVLAQICPTTQIGFTAQVPTAESRVGAGRGAIPLHQDRRSFLLAAFGLLRDTAPARVVGLDPAAAAAPTALPVPEARWAADRAVRSPRRAMLQWALETAPLDSAVLWPAGRIRLRQPCHLCGVCGALCPDKAIAVVAGTAGERLAHAPDRCLSCGLCVAVCPSGALELGDPGPLADLAGGTAHSLGEATTLRCAECGVEFPASVPGADPQSTHCLPCLLRRSAKGSALHA